MGLMLAIGAAGSLVLWFTLLGAIALTLFTCREASLPWKSCLWWGLAVALFHIVGYLGLRGWVSYRDRATA